MAAAGLFIFGVAGMALAGMGLYGLVSYTVRQSTQEIGIRMALGARRPSHVAFPAARAVAGRDRRHRRHRLRVGIDTPPRQRALRRDSTDPVSFAGALAVVVGAVVVATVVPAWRATLTPPLKALRP